MAPKQNGRKQGSEASASDTSFATAVDQAPVSAQRSQAVDVDKKIEKPSIARANIAVSDAAPKGSENHADKFKDYTVLQQHIMFWDRDNDGIIWPRNTYDGFRELGFNIVFCIVAVFVIHGAFSYMTRFPQSFIPDPMFRIFVPNIHKTKHGSDTGVYDTEGRFIPQKFEDLFTKYDQRGEGALTFQELLNMMQGNRLAVDPFGWCASIIEFVVTWVLVQKNGKVYKEDLRQTYDGSIFWRISEANKSGKGWDQGLSGRQMIRQVVGMIKAKAQ